MKKKQLLTILVLAIFNVWAITLCGQTVESIYASPENGKVSITYTLTSKAPCNVTVYCSMDNYSTPLRYTEGDVQNVAPGQLRKIYWDYAKEYPGKNLSSIDFKLTAQAVLKKVSISNTGKAQIYCTKKLVRDAIMMEKSAAVRTLPSRIEWDKTVIPNAEVQLFRDGQYLKTLGNSSDGQLDWFVSKKEKRKKHQYYVQIVSNTDKNLFLKTDWFAIRPKVPAVVKGVIIAGSAILFGIILYYAIGYTAYSGGYYY